MPDIAQAVAQRPQGGVELGAPFRRPADCPGHRGPVLQHQHQHHRRREQAQELDEDVVARLRQAQHQPGLGDEVAVDRDVDEPPHPDEDVGGGYVLERDQPQRRRQRREHEPGHGEARTGEDDGIDRRQQHQPGAVVGLDDGEDRVGGRREGRDRRDVEHRTRDQERHPQPQPGCLALLEAEAGPLQGPRRQPSRDQPERDREPDLPQDPEPQLAALGDSRLVREPDTGVANVS